MALGSPDELGIGRYVETTPIPATFSTYLNLALDAVLASLKLRKLDYRWANAGARAAQANMRHGDRGEQRDTEISYRYVETSPGVGSWIAWDSTWRTYAPALTNLSAGTGGDSTTLWRYRYVGGDVEVDFVLVLGTTIFSVAAAPTMQLPVPARAVLQNYAAEDQSCVMFDVSAAATFDGKWIHALRNASTLQLIYKQNAAGYSDVAPGGPFAWAAGDGIRGRIRYTPA